MVAGEPYPAGAEPRSLSEALLSALAYVRGCITDAETDHERERRAHERRLHALNEQQVDLDHRRTAQVGERAAAVAEAAEETEMLKRAEAEQAVMLRAVPDDHEEIGTDATQAEMPQAKPEPALGCLDGDAERVSVQMPEATLALATASATATAWREAAAQAEALAAAEVQARREEVERNDAEIAAIRARTAATRAHRLAIEEEIRTLAAQAVQRATPAVTSAPIGGSGGRGKLAH